MDLLLCLPQVIHSDDPIDSTALEEKLSLH